MPDTELSAWAFMVAPSMEGPEPKQNQVSVLFEKIVLIALIIALGTVAGLFWAGVI